MAELNLSYYTQKDQYSDGDIEDIMLDMAEQGISYEVLSPEQVDFAIIYHFSRIRQNILNWYPFKKDSSVLEIGGGCGAITGLLCQKCSEVVSVELSKRRASINYARHKQYDNLHIMVGNLNDMVFAEKFDYIVLNGVLEYAASFTEGEKPYVDFLKKITSFLSGDGKILIAIENRLGLKYFAGAPEDHTDLYYLGLNNYEGIKNVRTFSKKELTELLEESGLVARRFYYPYPDYKFPREIFTDETLQSNGYGRPYEFYSENRFCLFDESKVAHTLVSEGIAAEFVNSFLVEAGWDTTADKTQILYAKINSERHEKFQIATVIQKTENTVKVVKKALTREAIPFINRMGQCVNQKLSRPYSYLWGQASNGQLEYPYLEGKTLFSLVVYCVQKGEKRTLINLLKEFYRSYFDDARITDDFYTEEFQCTFGKNRGKDAYACVCPANVDLISDNIFYGKEKAYIIDYEWVFNFNVPVAFSMWRMINDLYSRISDLSDIISREEMESIFGIDKSDHQVFLEWSKYFAYVYVGCDKINKYAKTPVPLELKGIAENYRRKNKIVSKLYYDTGIGLNEGECISLETAIINKRFRVRFDLSNVTDIRYMRWDLADIPCWCIIDRIDSNCQVGLLPQGKYWERDRKTYFFYENPRYVIDTFTPGKVRYLQIEGRIEELGRRSMLKNLQRLTDELMKKDDILKNREAAFKVAISGENAGENTTGEKMLKKLVRKIFKHVRSKEATASFVSVPVGSVDTFHYENYMLHVVGWVFDQAYTMDNPRIAYYKNEIKVAVHSFMTVYRSDVARTLCRKEAEAGGFAFTAEVRTPYNLQVVMEYDTPLGPGGLVLGNIQSDIRIKQLLVRPHMAKTQLGDIRYFIENQVTKEVDLPPALFGHTVDVIIPVYNGYEYFDALFSSICKTNMKYRLLIVNDKSSDERVQAYLERYAASHQEVILLNNEENLGFLKSVNRALKIVENHVVLVNTDVELPYQWLERLMLPIIFRDKIASTTPFTTCGTICSFPRFCEDNLMFEGMNLWQVDDVFRTIRPQYPVMPTGVGFCMGMNLQVIKEIGLFDEENFGKGYGEENDWCQRAAKAGYKNVQVDNLFVYHKHGGSFLSEEKQRLLEEHSKALLKKYPNYNKEVAEYCQSDPMKSVRLYVSMQLLNQRLDVKTIVAFDHSLGGGATEYLEKKKEAILKSGQKFITIRYNIYENKYCVIYEYKQQKIEFFTEYLNYILKALGRVDEIWINELVTYQFVFEVLRKIQEWRNEQGAYLKMLMHDYFSICPAVNLMDCHGQYCGVGSVERCSKCIPENRSNACLDYESAEAWRKNWHELLSDCDEVTVFSMDTQRLLTKAYPDLKNLNLVPHEPHYLPSLKKVAKITRTLNIGVLGILSYKKGLNVIRGIAAEIEKSNRNVRLRLIGETDGEINSPVFSQTGRYQREQIPRLTLEQDIDIFFLPSICPETFSYSTAEVMSMDMPIAVFNIGAPMERVSLYPKGIIIERNMSSAEILDEIQNFVYKNDERKMLPVHEQKILFIAEEVSFASRYRVEHFRETLLMQGYASDYIQVNEWSKVQIANYQSVVIYRCSNIEVVRDVAKQAKEVGISVFYDIDDFVFDYDKISYLDFLNDPEYAGFSEKTRYIHECMKQSDGFITSTNALKKQIIQAFPGAQVVVKRNVASMEMQVLSEEAWKKRGSADEKVWIGYFSGSGTHNKDFAEIENVLERIMNEYPQVYLRIGGIQRGTVLEKNRDRVVRSGFTEWQKLPALIASVDINLMPLEDTVFHCCKSENKWMEAALVHVPSVMSRNSELEKVIDSGVTGFLCSSAEEWYKTLCNLIEDGTLRRTVGDAANKRVLERYTTAYPDIEAVNMILGK